MQQHLEKIELNARSQILSNLKRALLNWQGGARRQLPRDRQKLNLEKREQELEQKVD